MAGFGGSVKLTGESEYRKAEFIALHNELRTLLGKEQRELKNTTNNLT